MRRRGFLATVAAAVFAPLGLIPKRDVEAGAMLHAETIPPTATTKDQWGLDPVMVTRVDFLAVGKNPLGDESGWTIRERFSNGYSRTICTKRLDMEYWIGRIGWPTHPDYLPYLDLPSTWEFDCSHIGPGPTTFH